MKRSKIALRETNCVRFGKITLLFAFVLFAGVVLPELLMNLSRLQFTGIFYVFRMANSIYRILLDSCCCSLSTLCSGQLAPCTPRRVEPARPLLPAARILQPTTNHPHRKELIPWQLFLSVPPYWMLWCSPALHRATPTAMNSPTKSKACFQSQSPHSIPFCGDCKKTNTYKPMTSPIKGETAGITTSPMPDGRLWKPTAPSGSSTNNKLTNF